MKVRMERLAVSLGVAVALAMGSSGADAATANGDLNVQITIVADCDLVTPATLNFGATQGVLAANVDQETNLLITCTTSTPFNIGLDAGANESTTDDVTTRRLKSGSNFIGYQLYRNPAHSQVWGNTIGTNTFAASGTGVEVQYPVYGRVPPQTTPPIGTYTDLVAVTVTF